MSVTYCCAKLRTEASEARSSSICSTRASCDSSSPSCSCRTVSAPRSESRQASTTLAPAVTIIPANSAPMPSQAPVMMARWPVMSTSSTTIGTRVAHSPT